MIQITHYYYYSNLSPITSHTISHYLPHLPPPSNTTHYLPPPPITSHHLLYPLALMAHKASTQRPQLLPSIKWPKSDFWLCWLTKLLSSDPSFYPLCRLPSSYPLPSDFCPSLTLSCQGRKQGGAPIPSSRNLGISEEDPSQYKIHSQPRVKTCPDQASQLRSFYLETLYFFRHAFLQLKKKWENR